MNNDLIFDRPLPPPGNNDLIFGDQEPVGEWEMIIEASAPPAVAIIDMANVWDMAITAETPDQATIQLANVWDIAISAEAVESTADIKIDYDLNVWRGPSIRLNQPWQKGKPLVYSLYLSHGTPVPASLHHHLPWKNAVPRQKAVYLSHGLPAPLKQWFHLPWQQGISRQRDLSLTHALPVPHFLWRDLPWQKGINRQRNSQLVHRLPSPLDMRCNLPWQAARPRQQNITLGIGDGCLLSLWIHLPWGGGKTVTGPGTWIPIVPPTPPEPPRGQADLIFQCDLLPCNIHMDFAIPCCGEKPWEPIPILDTYFMLNELLLFREADGRPIACSAASVRLEPNTCAWDISATIPIHELEHLEENELMHLVVNGRHFLWFKESWSRSRQFGEFQSAQISGRSRHAELDIEPESGVLDNPINARQLADNALVNTGYDLDWRLPDWMVPANAYGWQNLSRIQRIAEVVSSVGGILWGDPADKKLIAVSKWPVAPWLWDGKTPRQLPSNIMQTLNERYIDNPMYNAVFARGELAGIQARVRINGSAGERVAETIVHPLITDFEAAREVGLTALSDSGPHRQFDIRMPLLDELGQFEISEMIEATGSETWKGLIRSIGFDASLENEALVIYQTLGIES